MKRFAILLIVNLLFTALPAQVNQFGTPLSKSYPMQVTKGSDNNYCITKDKFGVIYFGNDNNLVLRFDGSKWSTISLNPENETFVRALCADDNGIIYLGGASELGYIEPDSTGKQIYVSLTDRIATAADVTYTGKDTSVVQGNADSKFSIGEIQSIIIQNSIVYFMSRRSLIIYNTKNDSLSYINLRGLGYRQFERMFLIDGKIMLGSNVFGIFEYKGGKIVQMPGGGFFKLKTCLSILPFSDNEVIVGTYKASIYRYNYSTGVVDSSFIDPDMFRTFKNCSIYNGVRLFTGDYIYGTMDDGLFEFDKTGKYIGHWTAQTTNMLDNSVYALYTDPKVNSELWICTIGSITKIYVNLPFTEISEKEGVKGSISSFCKFNGSTYVTTNTCLFKSMVTDSGNVVYKPFKNISSEIFPLIKATVGKDSFLLAGSIDGVYRIDKNGNITLIKGDKIVTSNDSIRGIIKNGFIARSILQSKIKPNRFFFGKKAQGLIILDFENGRWKFINNISGADGMVLYMSELDNGNLILMYKYPDGLYKIPFKGTQQIRYTTEKGLPESNLTCLSQINGEVVLSTSIGLFKLNEKNDSWESCDNLTGGYSKNRYIDGYFSNPDSGLWVTTKEERYNDIFFERRNDSIVKHKSGPLALIPDQTFVDAKSIDGRTWIPKSKSIYVVDESRLTETNPSARTLFTKILKLSRGTSSLIMIDNFVKVDSDNRRYPINFDLLPKPQEFNYKYNSLSFYWTTPYMIQEENTIYSYKLEGFDNDWSKWDKVSYKDYTNLPFGKYTFHVKGLTYTNIETAEASYSFSILKPWYLTTWMIILYIIATILGVLGIIAAYTKRLKNENIRLEGVIAERTAVVVKQKEELESSIHYASRIQMALLPSQKVLSDNIKNYFVLFKPRDIVSGDFYWMTKKNERLYVVAADCTGHGVPGAFMSLLGMSFLDEIIGKQPAPRADAILNQLRLHITDSLKQVGGDDEAKDGMDMALLVIDFTNQKIEFSGAYNPCFRVRRLAENEAAKYAEESDERPDGTMSNGKYLLETIYASKMPIGISSRMNENFVFYDWALERGVSYYLFSDGYIDQFGGEHGRKFMKKNFKKLILEIQDYPMNKQKELLEKNLKDWMGQVPQIDDILVMGIRTE
ncbi:MAG TPA: SpoIIE family protein phosphatase [Bacteroidales bacterium]|nr:SpoIIE family protein phosphatase [Bacteroidales bacterium]